nr:vomeronasal type-2 receptor 116-like [Oryctolagus cuniculus]
MSLPRSSQPWKGEPFLVGAVRWLWKNYQYVLAFRFAIQEINKDSQLLPNLTLGFKFFNAFASEQYTLLSIVYWLIGINVPFPNYTCHTQGRHVAVIAGTTSALSVEFGTLLELYKNPQLTYGPFDPMLNDKDQFPSLYQMATSDSSLGHGMIYLLLHFGWTWVVLFVSDDMKGEQFLQYFEAEMLKKGICVAFTVKLPVTKKLYGYGDLTFMSSIRVSSANVHILYGDVRGLISVDISVQSFVTIGKVWIMTSKWDLVMSETNHMLHSLHGGFSFSPHKEEIPGLKHFVKMANPSHYPEDFYFSKLWLFHLHCSLEGSFCGHIGSCPPNTSLEFLPGHIDLLTISDSSYLVYNAVYTVAHVLHKMILEKVEMGSPGEAIQPMILPWQTPQSVCSQSCGPGFRKMSQEGRPICCYTCVLCPEKEIANQTDAKQCIPCEDHEYPNQDRSRCLPKLMTFLAFEESLGMALACMALCFSVLTAAVLWIFVKHQDTPIVKANNRTLSYILLITLLLCFLCSLLFLGCPNTATCLLQQIAFGLVFTVAVSTVLAKTITVILAFKVTKPRRTVRRLLISGVSNSVIPICFLLQLILCSIWLGISPPFIELDTHSEPGHIILVCNKGSVTAFYCVLGYLGSMALASFTVAFLARNLPDTFNEAKFLTFSMLVFCSVWVTFLPVYHSTKGKVMVAVEAFSILASSAGLLGCIFVPKCYVILIRPEMNSLKGLKNKSKF